MCDDVPPIMSIVKKIKLVERSIGRNLGAEEYGIVIRSYHNQKPFEIGGIVWSPPDMVKGLSNHQKELEDASNG